ncbi:MAG TPA: TIGR04086 family membrane protein [Bacillales bacterium]|nr:TIGR04086 family membrane protein [Bacillales bacterium]
MRDGKMTGMFLGLGMVVVVIVLASFVISLLLQFTNLSEASFATATIVISLLALLAGGIMAGRKAGERGWFIGAGAGFLYTILLSLIQFLGFETSFTPQQLLYFLMYVLVSALGGVIGVNLSSSHAKK